MKKFTKATAGFMLGLGLMGLVGCATTENYTPYYSPSYVTPWEEKTIVNGRKIAYEKKFKDTYIGKRLFTDNGELYVETLDGSEKQKLSDSPQMITWSFVTKDGAYVIYKTTDKEFKRDHIYLKSIKGNNTPVREITEEEYHIYSNERFGEY